MKKKNNSKLTKKYNRKFSLLRWIFGEGPGSVQRVAEAREKKLLPGKKK